MRRLLILTLFALLTVACASEPPLTIKEIQETREAEATVIAVEQQATIDGRKALIGSIAPEGTNISDTEPERGHNEDITYPFEGLPSPGGEHHPQWQKCDVYTSPVFAQHAIHAMEHGGVWITYNPDDVSETDISNLAGYSKGEAFVLVSPFPNQDSPIVVSAWGLQLEPDSSSDARIREFIDVFANGPQTPEPGANCAGGVTKVAEEG